MPYRGPEDPVQRARWLRARHAVARDHHPDLGGDQEELIRQLSEVDARFGDRDAIGQRRSPASPGIDLLRPPSVLQFIARGGTRVIRRGRQAERILRARIPRGWPGSRRYVDL